MMGIARSTYYDKPAISIDDTALVETMVVIAQAIAMRKIVYGCADR